MECGALWRLIIYAYYHLSDTSKILITQLTLFLLSALHTRSLSLALTVCRNVTGDVVSLFAGTEYASKPALVRYRVKKFVHACIRAIYKNRFDSIPYFISSWFTPPYEAPELHWVSVTFVSVKQRKRVIWPYYLITLKTKLFV